MDLQEEINEILRLAGLPPQLDEAAPSAKRLLPMFQGLLQMTPPTYRRGIETRIENEINWARNTLEREDRVIWYLRWLQLGLFIEVKNEIEDSLGTDIDAARADPAVEAWWATINKKSKQLALKTGTSPDIIVQAAGSMARNSTVREELTHYMGMPVAAIQNYVFQYELPQPLLNHFRKLGEEWSEDQKRVVDAPGPEDGGEILIDFGDGVAWWDLQKASCPQEAACMGHCGNSPREDTDDTILSLRKEFPMNGEMKYSCMLTFIRTENGMLTEMKGRGNDKPAEKYHKYIVPLLRHESIEGILGGGYMPENNFKLGDLEDNELRQQLIDEKPSLAGPTYFIEKAWNAGEYEEAANELERLMNQQGLDTPMNVEFDLTNAEKGMHAVDVIMGEWENYEELVDYIDDGAPKSLFTLLEEIDDLIITKENIDESIDDEFLVHVFESLPIRLVISVAKGLGITPSEDQHKMARKIAKVLDKEREGSRFFEYVVDAAHKAIDSSAVNHQIEKIKEQIIERLEAYASEGVRFQPHNIYVSEADKSNPVFGPWRMTIGMQELLDIVTAGMTQGGEDAYEDEDYNAWAHWSSSDGMQLEWDYHGTSDHRGKYGNHPDMELGTTNEKDKLAAEFDEDQLTLAMDQLISNTSAILNQTLRTGIPPASDHSRQKEMSLEAQRKEALFQKELMEIKRLAGLSLVQG